MVTRYKGIQRDTKEIQRIYKGKLYGAPSVSEMHVSKDVDQLLIKIFGRIFFLSALESSGENAGTG